MASRGWPAGLLRIVVLASLAGEQSTRRSASTESRGIAKTRMRHAIRCLRGLFLEVSYG